VIEVGGVEDHVHILFRLARTQNIADWMREVKRASSSHIKTKVPGFSWQSGYAAFSVDPTRLAQIATYVRDQEAHHRKLSFQQEFRVLLTEHSIVWDERYVWD
jgi:REP element-mobilizing transposase RayT